MGAARLPRVLHLASTSSIITPILAIKSQFLARKTHFDFQYGNVVGHINTNYLNYYSASLNSSSVYPNM